MSESTKPKTQPDAQRGAEVPAAASPPDQLRGVELSDEELDKVSGGNKFTPSLLVGQPVKVTGVIQTNLPTDPVLKDDGWGSSEDKLR